MWYLFLHADSTLSTSKTYLEMLFERISQHYWWEFYDDDSFVSQSRFDAGAIYYRKGIEVPKHTLVPSLFHDVVTDLELIGI